MTTFVNHRSWLLGAGAGTLLLLAGGLAFGPLPDFNEDEDPLPPNEPGVALEEALQIATGEHPAGSPTGVELENEGRLVYAVEFSDGFEIELDADTAEILETEGGDGDEDEGETHAALEIPAMSFSDARQAALDAAGDPDADVHGIELENEYGRLVYSVELSTSEVALDADTGEILATETEDDDNDGSDD